MHRAPLSGNSLVTKRLDSKTKEIHRHKLREIRSQINSARPMTFNHLKHKAKKERILEERYTEIERENRILLEKMSMMHKRPNRYLSANPKRSLNDAVRRKRLVEITEQN
jgi:hypothetical protein